MGNKGSKKTPETPSIFASIDKQRKNSLSKSQPSVVPKIPETTLVASSNNQNNSPRLFASQSPKLSPTLKTQKHNAILDRYEIGQVIGRGSTHPFSVVKKGWDKETKECVAIKSIKKKTLRTQEERECVDLELEIITSLNHPNIVGFKEFIEENNALYLVFEFMAGGALFDAIDKVGNYSEEQTVAIVRQIFEGTRYLHSQDIIHRDLRPENLLLTNREIPFSIKITDFGHGKRVLNTTDTLVGNPDYVAPEILKGEDYDKKVDIWSIGVITYILLAGYPPFDCDDEGQQIKNIKEARFGFPSSEWEDVSELAKDFIKKTLSLNPQDRPSAEEALQHPWISVDSTFNPKSLPRHKSFAKDRFKDTLDKEKKKNEKSHNL